MNKRGINKQEEWVFCTFREKNTFLKIGFLGKITKLNNVNFSNVKNLVHSPNLIPWLAESEPKKRFLALADERIVYLYRVLH